MQAERKNGWRAAAGLAVLLLGAAAAAAEFRSDWDRAPPGVWIGPDCWANRLQDWRLAAGRLELTAAGRRRPFRTVHLLTRWVGSRPGGFTMSVETGAIAEEAPRAAGAATGFLVGVGAGMDYRAAALIHHSFGRGAGLFAGVDLRGALFVRDLHEVEGQEGKVLARAELVTPPAAGLRLRLDVVPARDRYRVRLTATTLAGALLGELDVPDLPPERLEGQVGLVGHPGWPRRDESGGARFWYRDWRLAGERVEVDEERRAGPILSAQHTLSGGVLKLTAQLLPPPPGAPAEVVLQTAVAGGWAEVASVPVRTDSATATFRVAGWDASRDVGYRLLHERRLADGARVYTWSGTVRRDPIERDTLVVAGFTGNHNNDRRLLSGDFDWTRGVWFPHEDLTARVARLSPDLLFFSGDQVYEGLSPTRADREHLRLDYLYKWYLWCWAFRDLTRDIPCVTIPDDHDVYQGNLWGEGGRKTDKDDKGGYVHPPEFVRLVEHTQTDHLPDPHDPTPVEQGIGVYYTALTYGGVGFAILEDRKFKSGCNGRVPGPTRGRADHINDPGFDVRRADAPGLKLLGDRQLAFVRTWAADWRGQEMKMALSQTVFANMATHHGAGLFRLVADLDSNGWPQSGRNRALRALRKGFAFHLAGDQHLASLVHHGVDEHDDAIWSFAVPSIANFYPRAWMPEVPGTKRLPGSSPYLGRHRDGLGNRVTVWATTNPWHPSGKTGVPSTGREPAELHDKMPGYGIVRLRKASREYVVECWPRWAEPGSDDQYPGWPRTIAQEDNYGRARSAWLPLLRVTGADEPVVQVVNESTGEIEYTIRAPGSEYRPGVFAPGSYTVHVGEPGTPRWRRLRGLEATPDREGALDVDLGAGGGR